MLRVLLASGNAHKLRELRLLLAPLGLDLLSPADVGGLPEVDEDQPTFAGNAAKKARGGATASGEWCLADDSGLCADALDGAPGVRSARFAGAHATDAENRAELLRALAGIPNERRTAHVVCTIALSNPDGILAHQVSGQCHGRILEAERGTGGFGYDPLFLFTEPGELGSGHTLAELTDAEKAAISHRGRALRAFAAAFPTIER